MWRVMKTSASVTLVQERLTLTTPSKGLSCPTESFAAIHGAAVMPCLSSSTRRSIRLLSANMLHYDRHHHIESTRA